MADREVVVVNVGTVKGVIVTMAASRKSRMAKIHDECGDGWHIALSTLEGVTWMEHPEIFASDLLACFESTKFLSPHVIEKGLWAIFPELNGVPLSELGFQMFGNDLVSAAREDTHAHVVVARKTTWFSGIINRVVDPFEPVPVADRVQRRR